MKLVLFNIDTVDFLINNGWNAIDARKFVMTEHKVVNCAECEGLASNIEKADTEINVFDTNLKIPFKYAERFLNI